MFPVLHAIQTEPGWNFMLRTLLVYFTQTLIQPFYGFLGLNLSWKKDLDNLYLNKWIAVL